MRPPLQVSFSTPVLRRSIIGAALSKIDAIPAASAVSCAAPAANASLMTKVAGSGYASSFSPGVHAGT
jgi:hypothetical protein